MKKSEISFHRGKAWVLVFLGEAFAFFALILFLRVQGALATLLILLGLGVCWVVYNRFSAFQDFMASAFRNAKGFAGLLGLLFLLSIPFLLRDAPYLIHLCLTAGIYIMLATGLNYQLGSTNIVNLVASMM